MKNKKALKNARKLELNADTLLKLQDLSKVNGGVGDVVISDKNGAVAAGGSWVLCCRKG